MHEDDVPAVTPIRAREERALQWINDTASDQALARWIGQTVGLAHLRWAGRRFDGIPWTP
ncbi:MAG TPA: hypothetical protein VFU81_18150 [Thermomicrobiales bacterium]|nr:hypothetical protein [Thermomicrobiales bacterium]